MPAIDPITVYIDAQPPAQRELLWAAHQLIANYAPEIEAVWKWRTPFYMAHGDNICYIFNDKGTVKLGFYRGAKLPDPEGILIGYEKKLIRQCVIEVQDDLQQQGLYDLLDNALIFNAQRLV